MNGALILPPKPALITEECCDRCRHVLTEMTPVGPESICRRMPPVPYPVIVMTDQGPQQAGLISNFPSVRPEQVCGEFKRKIHHGHASATS